VSAAIKARLAIALGIASLALAAAPPALADNPPTQVSPDDGAAFTARVGQIAFQASATADPTTLLFPSRMDFYISRDTQQDPAGVLSNPIATSHASPDGAVPPAYTAGPGPGAGWPNKPGTYHWQAVYHDCVQALDCFNESTIRTLTVDPLPPPTQASPANHATVPYGGHVTLSLQDAPAYGKGGTRLYIEVSRRTALDSDGTFAHRFQLARPTAAGDDVYRYRFGRALTTTPGTYYWIVERFDCAAESDCFVTDDAIRSFTVAHRPTPPPAPQTHLTRHPPHRTHRHRVRFAFTSNIHSASFQCYYTGGWSHCRSPQTFRHLKPGRYRFKVRAVANGRRDRTPSKCFFRVMRRHHRP